MVIEIQSTSDSKEAVTAAMAGLAAKAEEKPVDPPKEDIPETPKQDESEEPVEPKEEEEIPSEEETKEEEDSEEIEAKDATDKPKKKGGFQKKIDRLKTEVAELTAKAQETEYWRQEALRMKTQTQQPQVSKADPTPDFSKKPKADDFKTAEDYEAAMFDYNYKQRRTKELQEEQQSKVKNEYQAKLIKHGERVEEFKKSFSEFEDHWNDALKEVGESNLSLTVSELILDSDSGPQLMKALADDPKEFRRICQLAPLKAAKELGKIEDRIAEKKPISSIEKTKNSKAPAPIKTVRAKGTAPQGYRDNMSQREYEEWRKQSQKRA